MVPHVFTILSGTTTQRRAQPGGTAPCLGASLQRRVPVTQHPWSSPSTQAGSEQGLGFSHFPVAQSRGGLGCVSCQAPCCLHQEERPWLACEQQARGGFVLEVASALGQEGVFGGGLFYSASTTAGWYLILTAGMPQGCHLRAEMSW